MKYTATIYLPGRDPFTLGDAATRALVIPCVPVSDNLLLCLEDEVAGYLQSTHVETLAAEAHAAMWGVANMLDYDNAPLNEAGREVAEQLFRWPGELYGPVLIIITE